MKKREEGTIYLDIKRSISNKRRKPTRQNAPPLPINRYLSLTGRHRKVQQSFFPIFIKPEVWRPHSARCSYIGGVQAGFSYGKYVVAHLASARKYKKRTSNLKVDAFFSLVLGYQH